MISLYSTDILLPGDVSALAFAVYSRHLKDRRKTQ